MLAASLSLASPTSPALPSLAWTTAATYDEIYRSRQPSKPATTYPWTIPVPKFFGIVKLAEPPSPQPQPRPPPQSQQKTASTPAPATAAKADRSAVDTETAVVARLYHRPEQLLAMPTLQALVEWWRQHKWKLLVVSVAALLLTVVLLDAAWLLMPFVVLLLASGHKCAASTIRIDALSALHTPTHKSTAQTTLRLNYRNLQPLLRATAWRA